MELQTKQPPELEFSMPEVEESLTAYLSAIGGAVIGLLLTLLVLAIWNGGTLNFTNTSKVNALQAGLTNVAADVATVNTNVDALGERLVLLEQEAGAVAALQKSLASLDSSLTDLGQSLSDQGLHLSELDTAVADLQVTQRNFDLFTAALTAALAEMQAASSLAPQPGEPATARSEESAAQTKQAAPASATAVETAKAAQPEGAASTSPLAQPLILVSADVAPDAVLIYLFVDQNADGAIDNDENLIVGAAVTLTAPDGEAAAPESAVGSAGTLFQGLSAGDYTVTVEDVQGYALASANSVTVNVDPQAAAGQIIYFAVVTTVDD